MYENPFTPGATRALDGAGRIAWMSGVAAVEPMHLLWALVLDETRASELLAQYGIDRAAVEARFPWPVSASDVQASLDQLFEPAPVPVPLTAALSEIVREARAQAAQFGFDELAGTEHLLSALPIVDLRVARFFADFGMDVPQLQRELQSRAGRTGKPIDPDFQIRWTEPAVSDHTDTLRVLDAAANRAREGLRVVEDYVRFSRNDAHLSRLLKELRHELTARLADLERFGLIAARDTQGDVGTRISTPGEHTRRQPIDIVTANCRRVEEALRTLEEFSKLLLGAPHGHTGEESTIAPATPLRSADQHLPKLLEQLRYRLYTIEKGLLTTLASQERLAGCDLYLLVTESLCHHGCGPAVREALDAGVRIVQLREKDLPDRRLLEIARRIRDWTRAADALLIVNDRPDIALLVDADGVHVGQDDFTVSEARRIVGPQRLVGVSTHTLEQARQAVLDGADYLGVGPCFSTTTKSFERLAGLDFVRQVAAEITLPWFAIGGISAANVDAVRNAGASRIAVSSAICSSPSPGQSAAELLDRLRTVSKPEQ
jgi:thiamine-phosphate pyrophosphorylase